MSSQSDKKEADEAEFASVMKALLEIIQRDEPELFEFIKRHPYTSLVDRRTDDQDT